MQAIHPKYPNKRDRTRWDNVHVEYPVRKFPGTGDTSTGVGHRWRPSSEVLRYPRSLPGEVLEYSFDHEPLRQLVRSQTAVDFQQKPSTSNRHLMHTPCADNSYVYHLDRRFDKPPGTNVHPSTEMRVAYQRPTVAPHLVTNKDQFKHAYKSEHLPPCQEPSFRKPLPALDTTHDGFEKLLDPYLTTSRLHHRPFTAEHLKTQSAREPITYYTFANVTWVRRPKPNSSDWRLPLKRPSTVQDREKFKHETREVRTHNRPDWVPGSFRTEFQDNFDYPKCEAEPALLDPALDLRAYYKYRLSKLQTNLPVEDWAVRCMYSTENSVIGSRGPVCKTIEQHVAKNKRLESMLNRVK